MKTLSRIITIVILTVSTTPLLRADSLDDLAREFWTWRAAELPVSTDDIPRLERPPSWVPDWSPAAVERYRRQMGEFEGRWKKMNASSWPVPRQVDCRLMGSALARGRGDRDLSGQSGYLHHQRNGPGKLGKFRGKFREIQEIQGQTELTPISD